MKDDDVSSAREGLGRVLGSFTVKEILIGHIDATEKRLDRIDHKLDTVVENQSKAAIALTQHANTVHAGAVGRAELYGAIITIGGIVVGAVAVLT